MRSDPFRERARALAVKAGLDPDAKIDRPGQRPMPVWCTFREAAHKEQMAAEAAATLPPQASQFQNAPLKVFGDHDEGNRTRPRPPSPRRTAVACAAPCRRDAPARPAGAR
jgi:tRNA-splicing ligase RtcB